MPRASSGRTRRKPESFYENLFMLTQKCCVSVRSNVSSRRANCSNIEKSLSILEIVKFCRKNKNKKLQENAESDLHPPLRFPNVTRSNYSSEKRMRANVSLRNIRRRCLLRHAETQARFGHLRRREPGVAGAIVSL